MTLISRLFRRPSAKVLDPWDKSEDTYVARYRAGIIRVASVLSTGLPIRTRFNPTQKCAELFFDCGVTLAQIQVHGEFGSPYGAVITTAVSLTEDAKKMIRGIFPEKLDVTFKNLM